MVFKYTSTSTLDECCYGGAASGFLDENDVQVSRIIKSVCEIMGVHEGSLSENTKVQKIVFSRWLIWYFALENGYKNVDCRTFFDGANFDHTTICSAMKKLPQDILTNKMLSDAFHKLKKMYATNSKKTKK